VRRLALRHISASFGSCTVLQATRCNLATGCLQLLPGMQLPSRVNTLLALPPLALPSQQLPLWRPTCCSCSCAPVLGAPNTAALTPRCACQLPHASPLGSVDPATQALAA
jgi:hypothetical protein